MQSQTMALIASGVVIVAAVARPTVGLMQLALLAPLLGRPIIPYPGLMFVLIIAIIVGSLYRLPIDRPSLSLPPAVAIIAAFMVFVGVQQLPSMLEGYTGSGQNVGSMFLRYSTEALAVVASGWVMMRRPPFPYLAGLVLAGILAAGLALVMYLQPSLVGPLGDLVLRPDRMVRPAGAFTDPNYFGMLTVTVLVAAFGWFLAMHGRLQRSLLLAAMGVLGAGLVVSQSRSALFSVAVGVLVVAFTRSRRLGMIVLALVGLAAAAAVPLLLEFRLTNSGGVATELGMSRLAESDEGRLDLVMEGPRLFLESPIFGVGLGGFVEIVGDASHNWFALIMAEQGLVGITLTVLLAFALVRALRARATLPRSIGYGVLSVLATGALFLEPTLETQWAVPAIIIITAAIVADWRQERTQELPDSMTSVHR
jgi:O-antigen ligase